MKIKLNKYRLVLVLLPLLLLAVIVSSVLVVKLANAKKDKNQADTLSQLNKTLPGPFIEEKGKTKLEAYMQMQADSLSRRKEDEDSAAHKEFNPLPSQDSISQKYFAPKKRGARSDLVSQEKRVNEQLDRLLKELNKMPDEDEKNKLPIPPDVETSADVARLEQLMAALQADTSQDPEMRRLDGMLDKIIRIQNPQAFDNKTSKQDSIQLHNQVSRTPEFIRSISAFYGLEQSPSSLSKQKAAIRAVVHEDQTLQDGSIIKLRLLENIYMGQQEIPANSFIFGICNISDERLVIKLDRIVYNSMIYPIELSVYDTDGIPGISIPGAITRDVAKQGLDRTIQTMNMTSLDPSLAAQATSASIESLKSLLSKKVKLVKVSVKAGHQVYLQ